MNRMLEIENLLDFIKNYVSTYNKKYNSNFFYEILQQYDYSKDELFDELGLRRKIGMFDSSIMNIDSNNFVSISSEEYRKTFNKLSDKEQCECYKLYLNIDYKYLPRCSKYILEYINKNKLNAVIKISNLVRSDNFIIRTPYLEDAKKIIYFVNHHANIKRFLRKSNPFIPRDDNVGITYDEYMSFNNCLANLLNIYFSARKDSLDKISADDFASYLIEFKTKLFTDRNFTMDLINDNKFALAYLLISEEELVTNICKIVYILLKYSLNKDPNINDDQIKNKIGYLKNIHSLYEIKQYLDEFPDYVKYENPLNVFHQYIKEAVGNYGFDIIANTLEIYCIDGNFDHITRINEYRNKFKKLKINGDFIKQVCNGSILKYIKEYCIHEMFDDTYKKYGKAQLSMAIGMIEKQHSLMGFTNGEYNLRYIISSNISIEEVISYIKKSCNTDYVDPLLMSDIIEEDNKPISVSKTKNS